MYSSLLASMINHGRCKGSRVENAYGQPRVHFVENAPRGPLSCSVLHPSFIGLAAGADTLTCSTHENGAAQPSALVTLPEATSPHAFIKWANNLPASNPPTWLGLAPNAEAAVLATRGEQLLSNWQVRHTYRWVLYYAGTCGCDYLTESRGAMAVRGVGLCRHWA